MKPDQSFQIFFLISFLSFLFSSGDVFAYKESDFYKLKNTKKCIECDLTDLNLSRLNLRGLNLSGSDLSGSDLSESDISGSNLSGVNLSRVNLSGTNLKNINLTGANLNRIIIDIKALSTLDLTESTFLSKSTLAEEAKKKKEKELRKKKEKELRKKKQRELRKKKQQELKKKKEKELGIKNDQELKKKALEGYRDFKFGMNYNQIKATGACKEWNYEHVNTKGYACYKVAGEKRNIGFGVSKKDGLTLIAVELGKFLPSYYAKLSTGLGKKYKEKYRLTAEQAVGLNKGAMIIYYEDARVTLVQYRPFKNRDFDWIDIHYTKEEHPTYKRFSPKEVSIDDF